MRNSNTAELQTYQIQASQDHKTKKKNKSALRKNKINLDEDKSSITHKNKQNWVNEVNNPNKFQNISNANKIYANNGVMLKKPVVPLHQIRKKNFKITEMKRNQNVRKMNYFMETIELKGQYSHYENENRRLHIHLNKLIKMNREKMTSQNFVRIEEDDSTFDINKKNDQNPNDHNESYSANQDT